ncbi:hypothetical protein BsWGS_25694 [Bradybaena similaris]
MRARSYVLLSLVYACLHLSHIVLSCVLLLNGWSPLSVRERAKLAEISVLGVVMDTYKEERTVDDTYTAAFRIVSIYTGHDLLTNVTKSVAPDNVYNISNFGSKAKCYADVEAGSRYILFLTLFDGQLSAKYDDLFGAASVFTESDDEEINNYLGWDPWTQWSTCGATCGGGKQLRTRECPSNNGTACIGEGKEIRSCNLFSCEGSHDLLTLLGVRDYPTGVTRSQTASSTYIITKDAKLRMSASRIYDTTLPTTFSIIMKFKISSRKQKAYFFVISDVYEKQQAAIFLGRKLKFQYLGNNYGFKVDVLDNRWHTLGLGVGDSLVTLYLDCDVVMKRRLRSKDEYLGNSLMLSIGPYFSQYGSTFEGEVEQLAISSDPKAAGQQCGFPILNEADWNMTFEHSKTLPPYSQTTTPTVYKPPVYGSDWSAWSACSATCGQGWQSRALYCRDHTAIAHSCFPVSPLLTQSRACYLGTCPDCFPPCHNGGTCLPGNICRCSQEFSGDHCQNAVCKQPCQNGGYCVYPGHCVCPQGYYGSTCEPLCNRGCYNGGHCVAPNICACPAGYHGKRCQRAECQPTCQHGGVCVSPDLCLCKNGYSGSRCQKVKCQVSCQNGGSCIPPNKCQCPPLFYGRRCQREKCQITCVNGGRCHNHQCHCPFGFTGRRCERSTCVFEQYLIPYKRTYRKVIREDFPVPCETWSYHTCFTTRLKYVLITKDTYRSAYRCV